MDNLRRRAGQGLPILTASLAPHGEQLHHPKNAWRRAPGRTCTAQTGNPTLCQQAHSETFTHIAVDMWTIGLQPNTALPPFCCARRGNARFAHIPTGNHNNHKAFIILIKGKGEWGRGLAFPAKVPPCGEACGARGRPGSKGGSGIFCPKRQNKGGGKKSSGPAGLARAFDRAAAAPLLPIAGSGRRDGPFRIEHRDGDLNKRRFDGVERPWTGTAADAFRQAKS